MLLNNIDFEDSDDQSSQSSIKGTNQQAEESSLVSSDSDLDMHSEESEDELDELIVESESDDESDKSKRRNQTTGQKKKDMEDILRIFAADVSPYVSNTAQGAAHQEKDLIKTQKVKRKIKIPKHLQAKISDANEHWLFGRLDQAIPLYEEVIKRMPQLAYITQRLSEIYYDLGDFKRSLTFMLSSATETRKDSGKWYQCANIALKIGDKLDKVAYCYNRAIKALHPVNDIYQILEMKLEKLQNVYQPQDKWHSIQRTLSKQIKFFDEQENLKTQKRYVDAVRELKKWRYKTQYQQGNVAAALESLDELLSEQASPFQSVVAENLFKIKLLQDFVEFSIGDSYVFQLKQMQPKAENIINAVKDTFKPMTDELLARILKIQIYFTVAFNQQDEKASGQFFFNQGRLLDTVSKIVGQAQSIENLLQFDIVIDSFLRLVRQLSKNILIPKDILNTILRQIKFAVFNKDLIAAGIYLKLGLACKDIGSNEEAVECLEKARAQIDTQISTDQNCVTFESIRCDILKNLSKVYQKLGLLDKAKEVVIVPTGLLQTPIKNRPTMLGTKQTYTQHFFNPDSPKKQQIQSPIRKKQLDKFLKKQQKTALSLQKNDSIQPLPDLEKKVSNTSNSCPPPRPERTNYLLQLRRNLYKFNPNQTMMHLQGLNVLIEEGNSVESVRKLCDTHLLDALKNIRYHQQLNLQMHLEAIEHTAIHGNKEISHPDFQIKTVFKKKKFNTQKDKKKTLRVQPAARKYLHEQVNKFKTILTQTSVEKMFNLVQRSLEFLLSKYWNGSKENDDSEELEKIKETVLKVVNKVQNLRVFDEYLTNQQTADQSDIRKQIIRKLHFKKLIVMTFLISEQFDRLKPMISELTQLQDEVILMADEAIKNGEEIDYEEADDRVWLCVILSMIQNKMTNKKIFFRNMLYRSRNLPKSGDGYPENIYERTLLATLSLQRGRHDVVEHFWAIHQRLGDAKCPPLVDLCLAICFLKQAFNRRSQQKELQLKQALGFMKNYMQKRIKINKEMKIEIMYNLARMMHFIGLVPTAMEQYEAILTEYDILNPSPLHMEIIQRTRFNLHLIYKGSGVSTGNHMRGLNLDSDHKTTILSGDKLKANAIWKAHELVMRTVI